MMHVLSCNNAHEIWEKLHSIYVHKSELSVDILQQKFFNYAYQNEGIAKYISGIEDIKSDLNKCDEKISDRMMMTRILTGLPSMYKHFLSAWDSTPVENRKLNELVSRLLIEEQRLKDSAETSEVALSSKSINKSRHPKPVYKESHDKTHNREGRPAVGNMVCNICKKEGHVANNCKLKKDYDAGGCFICHKTNHRSKFCRYRNVAESQASNNSSRKPGDYKEGRTRAAYTSLALINNAKLEESYWYADSGASEHMSFNKYWMDNYKTLNQPIDVKVGDGSVIKAIGRGDIKVKSFDGHKWKEGEITNVLHVPKLKCNLFSISSTSDKGYSFELTQNDCKLKKDGDTFIVGIRKENLYKLELEVDRDTEEEHQVLLGVHNQKIQKLKVWHERLAHQNVIQVRSILNKMDMEFEDDKSFFCDGCILGKQHVLPFHLSKHTASFAGEVIHADVCGAMEKASVGGARYFLLLKDDFSHYRTVFFMKHKSEARQNIIKFIKLVENQTGNKVKTLRTDNGLEEVNKEIGAFLEDKGIVHQKSCRYTPQQNGRIERENRTIVEAARSMLQSKDLRKELWAEAVSTAVYVINRSGRSSVGDKTPFELWQGKKPDIKNFQIFGSEAFVMIPKQLRKKWDPKGKKGIFVGYEENTKGYRIYLDKEGKIEVSRNVIFKPETNSNGNLDKGKNKKTDYTWNDQELNIDEAEEENRIEEDEAEEENRIEEDETGEKNRIGNDEVIEEAQETSQIELHNERREQQETTKPYKLRRRENLRPPARFEDHEFALTCNLFLDGDLTYQDAVNGPNRIQWREAIKKEFEALEENQTWIIVEKPKETPIIDTKWVFKSKTNEHGEPTAFKARLVVRGFLQKETFNHEDIYTPVARMVTVRILLTVANKFGYKVHQMDVKSAFLYGELEEEVFIHPPEGMKIRENKVLKLRKSLYGLKKSPRYWNKKFNEFMLKNGFTRSKADFCLYVKIENGKKIYVLLYVDDLIICGDGEVKEFKERLKRSFRMTDLGKVSNYLGLHITQETNCIQVDQIEYLKKVLKTYGMEDCKPIATPLELNFELPNNPPTDKKLETECKRLIGYLMYAMLGSRPDLCATVGILSRFQKNANQELFKALKRVLRYIKGTLNLRMIYTKDEASQIIQGYVDSDWAGDKSDRKSTTGYIIKVFNNAVSWSSRKQSTVALSSCEAEYVALASAAAEGRWIESVLRDLMIETTGGILLLEDNQSAIKIAQTDGNPKRLKHIDVKHHYIKQLVGEGSIKVKYLPSEEQVADILTKPVSRQKLEKLRLGTGLRFC